MTLKTSARIIPSILTCVQIIKLLPNIGNEDFEVKDG